MNKKLIGLFAFCLTMSWADEQYCNTQLTQTALTSRFDLSQPGVAIDKTMQLMWRRCAYQEQWQASDSSCTGTAKHFSLPRSIEYSMPMIVDGYDDWRIPNVNELVSIIEYQCVSPMLNLSVFPLQDTAVGLISGTPRSGSEYWIFNIDSGRLGANSSAEGLIHLLLVRDLD